MAAPTYDELLALVEALRATVARLETELEAARRAGKRQAAPFRRPPRPAPKTPGRHGHRPVPSPDHVPELYDVPLPDACLHCRGALAEAEVVAQYQTEIPRRPVVRRFDIHVGHCRRCGARVQGRHDVQTSDALGAAARQLGPDAQAAAVHLNKVAGLSHGKVAAVFAALFGIDLMRGASAQIGLRAARRLAPAYAEVADATRKVWGSNRTWAGAQAQGVLLSVLETCRRQARSALDFVSQTLRSFGSRVLPTPVLLGTR